jgi:hypothetical protein
MISLTGTSYIFKFMHRGAFLQELGGRLLEDLSQ